MWKERLAHALAEFAERNDGEPANRELLKQVVPICAEYGIASDAHDVLQETWLAIVKKMERHERADKVAEQVHGIIRHKAQTLIRSRDNRRNRDRAWAAKQSALELDAIEDIRDGERLSALLERLRKEYPLQHEVIALTVQSSTQDEARSKWQEIHAKEITPENFRQMYHRSKQTLRKYWEQSDD